MRASQVQSARLHYYDRSPINRTFVFAIAATAPHAYTVQWTYTVPAGRKAMIDSIQAYIRRVTSATTLGPALCGIGYTGLGLVYFDFVRAGIYNNDLWVFDRSGPAAGGVVLAGDIIDGWTLDLSTAGTVNYNVGAKIFEFAG